MRGLDFSPRHFDFVLTKDDILGRAKLTKNIPVQPFGRAVILAFLLFLIHFLIIAFVYDLPVRRVASDLFFPVVPGLGAAAFFFAASQAAHRSRRLFTVLRLFALSFLSIFIGSAIWAVQDIYLHPAPTFFSIADVFYFIAYLLIAIAILSLPSVNFSQIDKLKLRLSMASVMLSAAILFWNFLIGPLAALIWSKSIVDLLLLIIYPLIDLLLLWTLITLLFLRFDPSEKVMLFFLEGSLLLLITTDVLFTYQSLTGVYHNGDWLNLGWTASLLLGGLAGVYQGLSLRQAVKEEEGTGAAHREGLAGGKSEHSKLPQPKAFVWLSTLPYTWLIAAYSLLLWSYDRKIFMEYHILGIGVGILIALLLTRQMVVIYENNRMFNQLQQVEAQKAKQEREAYFKALTENASDITAILDGDGKYIYVSPSIERLLGYSMEELIGKSAFEFIHPEDVPEVVIALESREAGTRDLASIQYRYRRKDGNWMIFESIVRNRLDDPLVQGVVINSRDVTERVKAEAALRASEERYALAAKGANDGLWDWDLLNNRIYFSPRFKNMLGYSEGDIDSRPEDWFRLIHAEDLERVILDLRRHLNGSTQHFESEHRVLHKEGDYRWVLTRGTAVRLEDGSPYRMAGSLTDITNRKQVEDQLLHDALHDSLTGLPNRALFLDRLTRAIERSRRRTDQQFAVLILDMDLFKVINDSLGHFAGDQVLIHLANLLTGCVRSVDTVARLGGDEYAVLLEDLPDLQDAHDVSGRIHARLKYPVTLNDHSFYITASAGLVLGQPSYQSPEEIMRDADTAMYQAKLQGKSRTVVFDPSMRKKAIARLELESDLRLALERQEMFLHYQPILALESNLITGFEALLRWKHPERGSIPPADFIPIAEETGLIVSIGGWVLMEACRQMQIWQNIYPQHPPLAINVNLSARQLTTPDLIAQVERALEASGLDARCLKLEITETALIENMKPALEMIQLLRDAGIQIHIDDFGTGYSSLSYIQNLPVDAIKIDRSFITHLNASGNSNELLQNILRMAQDLGLQAIAEGVETQEQLDRLKSLNCSFGQGYYLFKPLTIEQAGALLMQTVTVCI